MSIKRTSSGGSSSGIVIRPYYHNLTATSIHDYAGSCDPWAFVSTSTDKYYSTLTAMQYIAPGEIGTFELPSSLFSKLQDGTIKGFAVGMNSPTEYFTFTRTGCTLTVTYNI